MPRAPLAPAADRWLDRPLTQALKAHVAALHREASDAAWAGDDCRARFLEGLAKDAIARGEDPVILF